MALPPWIDAPRKIPVVGPWTAKIGRLVDLSATPCSPTPQIVAYGFFTAVPMLIISLFKPEAKDQYLHRFGRPHKHRRTWSIKHGTIIFPQEPIPKGWAAATWFLGEWAQRVGWYFLVIDSTLDFFVNWTSLVYAYSGCPSQGMPYRHLQNAGIVYGEDLGWQLFSNFANGGGTEINFFNEGFIVPPKMNVVASLNAQCDPFPNPDSKPPGFQTRIIEHISGYVVAQGTSTIGADGRGYANSTGTFSNPFNSGRALTFQIRCDGNGAGNFDPSTADAWGYGTIGIEPDP